MPAYPRHQREKYAAATVTLPPKPVAAPMVERPNSILGETHNLSRTKAKERIAAFVEALPAPRKTAHNAMTPEEKAAARAAYHARMARLTPEEMEAFRQRRNESKRRRQAARKATVMAAE